MINPEKLKQLKQALPALKENESMSAHTSMEVGGKTSYFEAQNIDELILAVTTAKKLTVPYRVIGYGTNIIFSDWGFDGLIIANRTKNLVLDKSKNQIIADAGVSLSQLIMFAASNELSGLEPLIGIPGTVGGAILVNAGSHGKDIGSLVKSVTLLLPEGAAQVGSAGQSPLGGVCPVGKIVKVGPEQFGFNYRTSRLKEEKREPQTVILTAALQFVSRRKDDITADIIQYQKWRQEHQPLGEKSAGSVFRNPSGTDAGDKVQSAGYLLEQVGVKRWRIGDAYISPMHANWIINRGRVRAADIRKLVLAMRQAVIEKYDLKLKEEIEFLGDWTSDVAQQE